MRRGLILGRSVMSVMKTCTFTTCSGPAPAALRHLSIAAVARSNWATTSDGILPSCAWPTTPATVGACAGDVAIVANRRGEVRNDDALDFSHFHLFEGVNLSLNAIASAVWAVLIGIAEETGELVDIAG